MDSSSAPCVLIAASGTGGHLFPALHIARALKHRAPALRIEFVGSGRPLEKEIIDAAGFRRHVISTVGIKQRGMSGLLEYLWTFPRALSQTRRLFAELEPALVIGVGGYVSFIPVTLARLTGRPAWIHEAELRPGLANFALSLYASRVSLAFVHARMPFGARTVYTGHPVREELKGIAAEAAPAQPPRNLLIVGGSQGARALDAAMPELAGFVKERGLCIRHQCRPENLEALREAYAARQIEAQVAPFMDMAAAYSWADIILARAGASTTMEIGVVGRPAVFVPFPSGREQRENAALLEDAGKALIVEEGDSVVPRLREALEKLLNPSVYAAMRAAPPPGRGLDAADIIAKGCLELMHLKNSKNP